MKLKFGGGNGGHNGLSNIDEMIGNNYNRIRIGINHPGSKDLVSSYVLNKFTYDEMSLIEKKLDKVTNYFNILLDDQVLFLTKLAEDNLWDLNAELLVCQMLENLHYLML